MGNKHTQKRNLDLNQYLRTVHESAYHCAAKTVAHFHEQNRSFHQTKPIPLICLPHASNWKALISN